MCSSTCIQYQVAKGQPSPHFEAVWHTFHWKLTVLDLHSPQINRPRPSFPGVLTQLNLCSRRLRCVERTASEQTYISRNKRIKRHWEMEGLMIAKNVSSRERKFRSYMICKRTLQSLVQDQDDHRPELNWEASLASNVSPNAGNREGAIGNA